jgi:2-dehydro-3-deoxyphosphogluconate aldolase / (4S)-4-hydroxy-2-oxoglutarate aldolase
MARHGRLKTLLTMKRTGVIPVFYNPDFDVVRQVALACVKGGATAIEYTNRGDRAVNVFTELAKWRDGECGELILGVGSVCDSATVAAYINAGADFIVGPMLDEDVAKICNSRKIPYSPGCGTVTEIQKAHTLGVEICKIFPGAQVGGPAFVKAVRGPMPWTEIMPTGGVEPTQQSLSEWFNAGIVCAGMGSKLVTRELVATGDFDGIAEKVKDVIEIIRQIRKD